MRNSKTYLHPFQDELVYYPKKNGKECEFCGLSSIAHKHKPGTLPKDYERIEDEPMSNSTQNDHETHTACIGRIKKEGASATCCYCNPHEACTIGMKPTQNDWVYKSEVEMSRLLQQLEGMGLISPKLRLDIERVCIETNRATRADARKEVLEKVIEQGKILEDSITKDELQSGYYLSGVKRMEKAVLATLREEEGKP